MPQDVFNSIGTMKLDDFQKKEQLLDTIKERFSTYGYKQMQTSTFEQYDLYQSITGMINRDEMIKVIDPSGKVLVLRPDLTIPITRIVAANKGISPDEKQLYYISDVFRNTTEQQAEKEQSQAGIENFNPYSPALDAEVIALAIHTLNDLGFENFKLEIGHAGFFKELLQQVNILEQEKRTLQTMIQAKNFSEIDVFLDRLVIDAESKSSLKQIPLLYGKPENVMERAETIAVNENMRNTLQELAGILDVLKIYDVERFISFDLGLINDMNYYSGIIFQGFVENAGKPVLMGGRYDKLADQFGTQMPAIGFAFDIDSIFIVMKQQNLFKETSNQLDVRIDYINEKQREALATAQALRNHGYRVVTGGIEKGNALAAKFVIRYGETGNIVNEQNFSSQEELLQHVREGM